MKVLLVLQATGNNYSVEAGLADDVKQFDHHGKFEHFPPPSNNPAIPTLGPNDIVEITHLDADTFLALLKMAGKPTPRIDLDIVAKIDTNGSSVLKDLLDPAHLYMQGVGVKAKSIGFPTKPSKEPVDVTSFVDKMFMVSTDELISLGREVVTQKEQQYKNLKPVLSGKAGLWIVDDYNAIDPSRPYRDGIDVVMVYRKDKKSFSIFCNPKSKFEFGGKEIAGIKCMGHPQACGSPRDHDYTEDDAKHVFEELTKVVNKNKVASIVRFRGAIYKKVAVRFIRFNGALYRSAALPERSVLDLPKKDLIQHLIEMILEKKTARRMPPEDFDLAWHEIGGLNGCVERVKETLQLTDADDKTLKKLTQYCSEKANVLSGGRDWRKI